MSVWEKIDLEEYKKANLELISNPPVAAEPTPLVGYWDRLRTRSFWTVLNAVATAFWIYVILKIFVGDFDRWIVSRITSSLLWVVDYRFFILLTIAAIIFAILRKWVAMFALLYIWFFPLVLLFWKIPRFYLRARNSNLLLGTIHVIWSLGRSLKFTLIAAAVFALSALAIAVDSPKWMLLVSIVLLLGLWFTLLIRAFIYAFVPSKFISYQQKILGFLIDSDPIWNMAALPAAAKSTAIERLNKSQIDQLVHNASMGLLVYGLSAVWAEKLDQYRKSGISVMFNAISVLALVAQALVIFTLVNAGIYRIQRSEFTYAQQPTAATFLRYSLSSMYASEIEELRPVGTAASLVGVAETVSCAVIVLVLIASLVFSLKQSRDDRSAEESIQAMRAKADDFADKLMGEYRLPLIDLVDRISELGSLFSGWIRQLLFAANAIQKRANERGRSSGGHAA